MLDSTFSVHEIGAKCLWNHLPRDQRKRKKHLSQQEKVHKSRSDRLRGVDPAGRAYLYSYPRSSARISRSSSEISILSNKSGRFSKVFFNAILLRHRRITS